MTRRRLLPLTVLAASAVLLTAGCATTTTHDGDPERRTFALPGRSLVVDVRGSAVELVPGGTGDVAVTRWFTARKWRGDTGTDWRMDGDTLTLRTTCSGVWVDCSSRHRVAVPKGVAVTVRGDDEGVRADGLTSGLRVRTVDGGIRVVGAAGPLDLRTRTGAVSATGLRSATVAARSVDGRLRLAFAEAPKVVATKTARGSTTVRLPATSYRVDARSRRGRVRVSVRKDAASSHVVTARSVDGRITVRPRR